MKLLSIGQVAKQAGVSVETIRFYERENLIEEPLRRESGYRQYPADVVARLQFIKKAKDLGFSLKEIMELLSLRVDEETTCHDVKHRAEVKLAAIDEKIKDLRKMRKALEKVTEDCNGRGATSACPFLDALKL